MEALEKEASASGKKVVIGRTGCIGICQYEPIVEVFEPGKEKVTYVKMDAQKAVEVFRAHILGGRIREDYTIGANAGGEKQ